MISQPISHQRAGMIPEISETVSARHQCLFVQLVLYALQPASYALLITAEGLLRIPYEAREDFLHRVLLAFDGRVAGGDHMQRP